MQTKTIFRAPKHPGLETPIRIFMRGGMSYGCAHMPLRTFFSDDFLVFFSIRFNLLRFYAVAQLVEALR
jgi:hypothetical protein